MISVLISNLKIMGILALLFCGSFGANTLLGLYYNIGLIKENFSISVSLIDFLLASALLPQYLFIIFTSNIEFHKYINT